MHVLMQLLDSVPTPSEQTEQWLLSKGCHPWFRYSIVKPAMLDMFFLVQLQSDKVQNHVGVMNGVWQ